MKTFLKYFLAAFLAFFTAILLFAFGLFGSMMISSEGPEMKITENSVLHLEFKNEIVERQEANKFKLNPTDFKLLSKDGLDQIVIQIEKAAVDSKIKGIFLDFRDLKAGYSTTQEIRAALTEFKKSDKWIVAYTDIYTQKAYYLASVADEVYVEPEGSIEFKGLMSKIAFLKGTLEKIGVEMQIARPKNNRFKSAVEPYLLDSMSAANELQTTKILDGIWTEIITAIGTDRNLSMDQLNSLADNFTGIDVRASAEAGLITAAKYRDEVESIIMEKLNIEDSKDMSYVELKDYDKRIISNYTALKSKSTNDKIAVIYAVGEIGLGEGNESEYQMGSDNIAKAIKEARENDDVKAVVLRVNSPGGGVLASDVIWREMVKIRETKKVVVSMGDLAASGGYYIATPSDKIYAQENTITGSIGVFGVIPNMKDLNEDILGLKYDEVKTNKHADFFDFTRPMRDDEMDKVQLMIDNIYQNFLSKVGDSRGLSVAEVDNIAQGRVWAGNDAKEIGLVDEIGGLDDAIIAAASLVELDDYGTINYPIIEVDPYQELINTFIGTSKTDMIESELSQSPELLNTYRTLKRINSMKGLQMRMQYDMVIY